MDKLYLRKLSEELLLDLFLHVGMFTNISVNFQSKKYLPN